LSDEAYYPWVVHVSGDYAYLLCADKQACGGGLEVVDIRNPAQPIVTGRLTVDAQLSTLAVSGNHAYVTSGSGFWIIDVSNPADPVFAVEGFGDGIYMWGDVAVIGNYAYLTGSRLHGLNGLIALDVSDPTDPQLVGVSSKECTSIQVVGNHAYLWNVSGYADTWRGLEVFDLSDPTRPVRVGECEGPGFGPLRVAGDYAYAVWDGILQAIDLTDPVHPVRLDGLPIAQAKEGNAVVVRVLGNCAYLATDTALQILDVSDPARPVLLGSVKTSRAVGRYIALDLARPFVYAAEIVDFNTFFLAVFDVSDPTHPVRFAEAKLRAGGGAAFRIRCSEDHVFVSHPGGGYDPDPPPTCVVFDVRNPAQPVESLGVILGNSYEVWAFSLDGHYLYAPYYNSTDSVPPTLGVVDIGDPGNAVQVGAALLQVSGAPYAFHVSGGYAYVGYYASFTGEVVEVSDPATPRSVTTFEAGVAPKFIQVEGRYAYVAGRSAIPNDQMLLRVIDVKNPTMPWLLDGAYEIEPSDAYATDEPYQVVGNLIYLADAYGLTILEAELPGMLKLNPPVLSGNTLTLSWNGGPGIKLQETTSLTTPNWADVPGSEGVSQITLPNTDAVAFFRLIQP